MSELTLSALSLAERAAIAAAQAERTLDVFDAVEQSAAERQCAFDAAADRLDAAFESFFRGLDALRQEVP
ncbi:MAG: hypothetical protein ACREQ5_05010 [Candidatus Dormibacteria bacterium]